MRILLALRREQNQKLKAEIQNLTRLVDQGMQLSVGRVASPLHAWRAHVLLARL